jgi:UDP-glucose 4-epimerase
MNNAVITGVAGFVGSNLAKKLLTDGWQIIGIDNLSYGFLDNIEDLLSNDNFRFIQGDIRDQRLIEDTVSRADVIVHLAAYKIPRYGNALNTLKVNTLGTQLMLNLADRIGAKFVFASTSDVFGKNPILPFNETSDLYFGATGVKRWAYAISKLYDEHLCLARSIENSTSVTILRYFGGYGPHQNLSWWGGPQSVFINQILETQPLTIHGDGLQTRTFTYIDDMVEGTITAIKSQNSNGEIFNIGLDIPVSILELAKRIWGIMCSELPMKIIHVPYSSFGRYEDVRRRIPDTRKAENLLDFKATITIDEGLPRTIEWQREAYIRRKDK